MCSICKREISVGYGGEKNLLKHQEGKLCIPRKTPSIKPKVEDTSAFRALFQNTYKHPVNKSSVEAPAPLVRSFEDIPKPRDVTDTNNVQSPAHALHPLRPDQWLGKITQLPVYQKTQQQH
jgi:hypothetical protein